MKRPTATFTVTAIELSKPLAPLPTDGRSPVLALARWRGTPLGWTRLNPDNGLVAVGEIEAAVRTQLAWPLIEHTLTDRLPPGDSPPVSVIVCTRNRPALLDRCLASITGLKYPAFEVIVVDNAPGHGATRDVVGSRARYVREDRPGLDWARNRGIAEARHDIIAFTDDDATVDPDWLTGIAAGFANPGVMAVTGLVAPMELATPAQVLFERVYGGMGKGFRGRLFHRDLMRPSQMIAIHSVGVGANMAFRRAAFEQVGEFDTALDVGTPSSGGGDLDMFHRVVTGGLALWYEPRALVWHQHRREEDELKRQLFNDGRSFGVYLQKLWKEKTVPRASLFRFVTVQWGRWLVGRVVAGMLGRHRMPLPLLWAGLRGALTSVGAYRATYRNDRRLRARAPVPARENRRWSVSVIVPVYNAKATLAGCLESVRNQTHDHWEIIVVDDGSTDGSLSEAEALAARDSRITVLRQTHEGVSAARNLGLAKARYPWVLFLDSDDWIAPTHLQRMTEALAADGSLDAVHCGWSIATSQGEVIEEGQCRVTGDLFPDLARHPAFIVHACVIRGDLVRSVGGFDSGFSRVADWVLWQRIARAGGRFGRVAENLAGYRMRPGSMSSEPDEVMDEALRVIALGHGPDPVVPSPVPRHRAGRPQLELEEAQLAFLGWPAGITLAQGNDARGLLGKLTPYHWPGLAAYIGEIIHSAAPRALGRPRSEWARIWPRVADKVGHFLTAVERHVSSPGFARSAWCDLARRVLPDSQLPCTIGLTHGMRLELTEPIENVKLPPGVERLWCSVELEGRGIGSVELPVCDGEVSGPVLADQVADRFAWQILGWFFSKTVYTTGQDHDTAGWDTLVRETWNDTASEQPARSANGRSVVEVSAPLPALTPDLFGATLDVTIGGSRVGRFRLTPEETTSPDAIRSAITDFLGYELCRVVVREAVIGHALDDRDLRARLRARAGKPARTPTDAALMGRHPALFIGGSGSRRARLPVDSLDALTEAATLTGQPFRLPDHRPRVAAYVPEILEDPVPRLPAISTPGGTVTDRLPVLLYHQVAESGSEGRARYRVSPREFESQLRYLRDAGFSSVSLADWRSAMGQRRALPGRALILTFNDGYLDFASCAWPLLRQYGFSAVLFVVSGRVGAANDWDHPSAAGDRLLDWDQLRRLRDEGLEIGSHSVSHPRLTGLSAAEVIREAAGSRAAIQRELGQPVTAFAYPFGDHDAAIQHLVGATGYDQGFTAFPSGRAPLFGNLLAQPRIEIMGDEDLAQFITRLEDG